MGELSKLKGLGPKSEQWLNDIGIHTEAELREVGPVFAYIKLKNESSRAPSLNFLYAMVGALAGENWVDIARTEKGRLLLELDGYEDIKNMLRLEGIEI